ncbi:MAG: FeoB-associated Cys-rich membrane protein [Spirochaetales bacterium]|nr:FeoB-associated Cys-rich membrane protein [Spirochaetales bacterium]
MLWTVIISLILLGAVFLIVRSLIRDRRRGRCTCGANCLCCPMRGQCHKAQSAK